MPMIGTEYQPGPNDFHVNEDGQLLPGLGADEPTPEQRRGTRSIGEARMRALQADAERALDDAKLKERALALKEKELAEREARLAAAEKAAASKAKG